MTDEEREQLAQAWAGEDDEKLRLLLKHYDVEPLNFYSLALALARDFVPGFQEKVSRGRKIKWTDPVKAVLVVEIERLVIPNDPTHGVERAAIILSQREPWKSFLESKDTTQSSPSPAGALRAIYYDARGDKLSKVFRSAFESYKQAGTTEQWTEMVLDIVRNPHP